MYRLLLMLGKRVGARPGSGGLRAAYGKLVLAAVWAAMPNLAWADQQKPGEAADPTASETVDATAAHLHPHAHSHDEKSKSEVTITGGRDVPLAASATTVTGGALKLRPMSRPADLLEASPGLISVQHSGGGKSNQYFLRGFDIDHGTDLALSVDGIPINLVSHGHGQGYADMHFIIPELVAAMHIHKGPYAARFGDFATAGAVRIEMADVFHESQASFTVGQYGVVRSVGIVSREVGERTRFVLAGEAYGQNGPFINKEKLRRFNLYVKATHDLSENSALTLSWMSHSGRWNASGQLPLREVLAGRLDRFGSIDPSEGGTAQRHGGSLRYRVRAGNADVEVMAYGVRYNWSLYSNFSFFLEDPTYGDQIEQRDRRSLAGLQGRTRFHHHFGALRLETTLGVQGRYDSIENGLHKAWQRQRLGTQLKADIDQTGIGGYVDERLRYKDWLTLAVGMRMDRSDATVDEEGALADGPSEVVTGSAGATLFSPKVSAMLSPLRQVQLFANFGRGFHSNDARGAARRNDPAQFLVPATGVEFGLRVLPITGLTLAATAYRLDLDSEQVFVGDAGTTEPSAASTRMGVEVEGRYRWGRWLNADVAATFNRARFTEGAGGLVPLAPRLTVGAGLTFRTPWGTFGGLRFRHVGERPANEDDSIRAEGFAVADARLGHRIGAFELVLDAQNITNTNWREVQFASTSQLPSEPAPVEEIHFTPGWPFTFRATARAYF